MLEECEAKGEEGRGERAVLSWGSMEGTVKISKASVLLSVVWIP